MYAIKKLVFDSNKISCSQVKEIILNNSLSQEYLNTLRTLNFFGNDNDEVDNIAKEIFAFTCDAIKNQKLSRGEKAYFLPACIMFDAVGHIGRKTTASLDGRLNYEPICDSGGCMIGKEKTSLTALINSVCKINPKQALGTWIVNAKYPKKLLEREDESNLLKTIVSVYFKNGGNQIQINSIDKETLIEALTNQKLAESLIVRVGGYSARFSSLSNELKKNIIDRKEY